MTETSTDPERTLRLAARGDGEALTRLYEGHVDGLYAFVFPRVLRDASLAEDVVQETFLRALARPEAFDPARGSLRIWLCLLARNAIRDQLRAHRRADALASAGAALDATLGQIFQGLERGPLGDEVLARAETRALVATTIANLPSGYGAVLEQKYVEGASMREIAATLAVSEDAAKSLLARARRAFRETFGALAEALGGAAPRARQGGER